MRTTATILHRWAGLITAAFLVFSGLTGAVISWDHELDALLNPHLNDARASGTARDALTLAGEIEARHPQVQVTFVPLAVEAGHSYAFGVEPRVNPTTQQLHEPGFNQVFIDPASSEELGKREWGAVWPITRETFVSFLYKLHYSLHLPEIAGTDQWGVWLLGVIAMIWVIDCFVGFVLTLPARRRARLQGSDAPANPGFWQRWKPAWRVRTKGGKYKLNFDLHRAFSLWTWLLLFIIAFTAFSLNLYREVFFPAMSLVSNVTPSPFDLRTPRNRHEPIMPTINFAQTLERANAEARARGWDKPAGSMFYSREYGIYGVLPPRRKSRHRWRWPSRTVPGRRGWPRAGRSRALERHGGRYLCAGAVSAAFGPHPRPARALSDFDHGRSRRHARDHRGGDLVAQKARARIESGRRF
jgi:uncharacterized iron-regulated membrane protein